MAGPVIVLPEFHRTDDIRFEALFVSLILGYLSDFAFSSSTCMK